MPSTFTRLYGCEYSTEYYQALSSVAKARHAMTKPGLSLRIGLLRMHAYPYEGGNFNNAKVRAWVETSVAVNDCRGATDAAQVVKPGGHRRAQRGRIQTSREICNSR